MSKIILLLGLSIVNINAMEEKNNDNQESQLPNSHVHTVMSYVIASENEFTRLHDLLKKYPQISYRDQNNLAKIRNLDIASAQILHQSSLLLLYISQFTQILKSITAEKLQDNISEEDTKTLYECFRKIKENEKNFDQTACLSADVSCVGISGGMRSILMPPL